MSCTSMEWLLVDSVTEKMAIHPSIQCHRERYAKSGSSNTPSHAEQWGVQSFDIETLPPVKLNEVITLDDYATVDS